MFTRNSSRRVGSGSSRRSPVGAAIAARIALRRVQVSPLGVTRRVTPRPPRVYRVNPLAAGIAELAHTIGRMPRSTNGQIWVFAPGILLVLTGLVIAGPWLTMARARLLARRTSRPALLVAGRRLADDPKAGFRAVSGLVGRLRRPRRPAGRPAVRAARRSTSPHRTGRRVPGRPPLPGTDRTVAATPRHAHPPDAGPGRDELRDPGDLAPSAPVTDRELELAEVLMR